MALQLEEARNCKEEGSLLEAGSTLPDSSSHDHLDYLESQLIEQTVDKKKFQKDLADVEADIQVLKEAEKAFSPSGVRSFVFLDVLFELQMRCQHTG